MERLQKIIAQAGIASRRKAEAMIVEGRVEVNGEIITELGFKAKKGDAIYVDGKPVIRESKVYFIMNKPKKSLCTNSDDADRETVVSMIHCKERIFSVGRLDYDTSGVLLLTNDGDFANMVIHPKYQIPKVYNLTINGILTVDNIRSLKAGIALDDGYVTRSAKVKVMERDGVKKQTTFDLTIYEGKNHQVKRMMEALGYEVRRLHRKQLGFLQCSDLRQGEYRILKPFEIRKLKALANEGTLINVIKE